MDVKTLSSLIEELATLKDRKKELAEIVKENNAAIEAQEKQVISAMLDLADAAGLEDPSGFTVDVSGRRYGITIKPYYSTNYARITSCTLTVEYNDGTVFYRKDGKWVECAVYYRTGGAWKQVVPYYRTGDTWKQV